MAGYMGAHHHDGLVSRPPREGSSGLAGEQRALVRGALEDMEENEREDTADGDQPKSEHHRERVLAAMLHVFIVKEAATCNVEKDSVYGAAVVMPQLARSAGWAPKLCVLAMRSYLFLILNCFLQWFMVYSLVKEEIVMDKYSGQMYLCNFGAKKSGCPEADGCLGPGGTRITPSRMYSYEQWNIQNFVKNSLVALFPEKAAEINDKVDPGEYGLESMVCRLSCTFLFIVAVTQEFQKALELLRLLYVCPAIPDSWITEFEEDEAGDDDPPVKLQIAGMPRMWKIINVMVVFIPQLCLWQFTCRAGMTFLLETSSIQDTIVNSTALTFVLNIDELLFETLSTTYSKQMLEMVRGFPIVPKGPVEELTSDHAILKQSGMERWWSRTSVPQTALITGFWWLYFLWAYYSNHCHLSDDGVYISNPMHLPVSTVLGHLSAFLPQHFPVPQVSSPYWTMPKEH